MSIRLDNRCARLSVLRMMSQVDDGEEEREREGDGRGKRGRKRAGRKGRYKWCPFPRVEGEREGGDTGEGGFAARPRVSNRKLAVPESRLGSFEAIASRSLGCWSET